MKTSDFKVLHDQWVDIRDEFTTRLLSCANWENWDDEDDGNYDSEFDDPSEHDIIFEAGQAAEEGVLVKAIGIKFDSEGEGGRIGFHCGKCKSRKSKAIFEKIARWVYEMDVHRGDWQFFATIETETGVIGIDLMLYGMWRTVAEHGGKQVDKSAWEFDPQVLFRKAEAINAP